MSPATEEALLLLEALEGEATAQLERFTNEMKVNPVRALESPGQASYSAMLLRHIGTARAGLRQQDAETWIEGRMAKIVRQANILSMTLTRVELESIAAGLQVLSKVEEALRERGPTRAG